MKVYINKLTWKVPTEYQKVFSRKTETPQGVIIYEKEDWAFFSMALGILGFAFGLLMLYILHVSPYEAYQTAVKSDNGIDNFDLFFIVVFSIFVLLSVFVILWTGGFIIKSVIMLKIKDKVCFGTFHYKDCLIQRSNFWTATIIPYKNMKSIKYDSEHNPDTKQRSSFLRIVYLDNDNEEENYKLSLDSDLYEKTEKMISKFMKL